MKYALLELPEMIPLLILLILEKSHVLPFSLVLHIKGGSNLRELKQGLAIVHTPFPFRVRFRIRCFVRAPNARMVLSPLFYGWWDEFLRACRALAWSCFCPGNSCFNNLRLGI